MFPIDHFYRSAAINPSAIAAVDNDWSVTYADLVPRVKALAAALQVIDPNPQSRVGICAYNTFEHLLAWLAVFAAGKTWVALNPRNGSDELGRIIKVTKPSILIADSDCLDKISPHGATVIVGQSNSNAPDDLSTLDELIERHHGQRPERHNLKPDDIQALKFTGGSSGTPKGVVQTYRVWNTCIASLINAFELNSDDRNLIAAPMTHGTNTLIMPTFSVGGSQAFMRSPKPAAIIDAIERLRPTTCFLPPTVIYMMMAEPGVDKRDFASLRHLIVGGAAIRADEVSRAMALFNNAVETCYGQTEAPQIATCMRARDWQDPRNAASTGRATFLTDVGIMDPNGTLLDIGESGEIVIKGDLVMQGYLEMADVTADTIKDGWLHTGDIGIIDERGFVFIKDRIRDVIITGGFNVYPSDVEAVLGTHPDVRECVVFGVDDDKWGEAVQAAVEVHDGAVEDEDGIIAFVKERLDSVKTPKRIHFSDALPRSPVGKVLRREAKAQLAK
jgi:fatty-acyl-CoA synthase